MNDRDELWIQIAANILKTQIKFHQLTYASLNAKLKAVGIQEKASTTARKITRGKFSLVYFLQCLHVMGIEQLDFAFYFKQLLPQPLSSGNCPH